MTSSIEEAPHSRPRRNAVAVPCVVQDELLVYVPSNEVVVALNATASAVWDLCDGEQSVSDIAAALGRRFNVPGEAVLADIQDTLAKLASLGLLDSAAN